LSPSILQLFKLSFISFYPSKCLFHFILYLCTLQLFFSLYLLSPIPFSFNFPLVLFLPLSLIVFSPTILGLYLPFSCIFHAIFCPTLLSDYFFHFLSYLFLLSTCTVVFTPISTAPSYIFLSLSLSFVLASRLSYVLITMCLTLALRAVTLVASRIHLTNAALRNHHLENPYDGCRHDGEGG
jgi:hypothetical protein